MSVGIVAFIAGFTFGTWFGFLIAAVLTAGDEEDL